MTTAAFIGAAMGTVLGLIVYGPFLIAFAKHKFGKKVEKEDIAGCTCTLYKIYGTAPVEWNCLIHGNQSM